MTKNDLINEVVYDMGGFLDETGKDRLKVVLTYKLHVLRWSCQKDMRSSTFKNWGLLQTNSVGVIDRSYCGDNDMWRMLVYATRDTVIHVNDRIAQFRIMENQPKICFEEVQSLAGADRGRFGSTGKA